MAQRSRKWQCPTSGFNGTVHDVQVDAFMDRILRQLKVCRTICLDTPGWQARFAMCSDVGTECISQLRRTDLCSRCMYPTIDAMLHPNGLIYTLLCNPARHVCAQTSPPKFVISPNVATHVGFADEADEQRCDADAGRP